MSERQALTEMNHTLKNKERALAEYKRAWAVL
jgi:hypothetical protein